MSKMKQSYGIWHGRIVPCDIPPCICPDKIHQLKEQPRLSEARKLEGSGHLGCVICFEIAAKIPAFLEGDTDWESEPEPTTSSSTR